MGTALVNYDEGRRRIQLARSHDEIADIRDKAQALAEYARRAKDSELLGWVSEIKVRAERRAGELIAEQQTSGELNKQGRPEKRSHAATISEAKITKSDSSRWQKMAGIQEDKFESAIATAVDQLGEVTTAFMLRQAAPSTKANGKKRKAKPRLSVEERSDRDGQLARFYIVVSGCQAINDMNISADEWLRDAPQELRHAIEPAVQPAFLWLEALMKGLR